MLESQPYLHDVLSLWFLLIEIMIIIITSGQKMVCSLLHKAQKKTLSPLVWSSGELKSAEPFKILDKQFPSACSGLQDVSVGPLSKEISSSWRAELVPSLLLEVCFAQPPVTKAGPHFRHFSTLMNWIVYTSRKRKKKTKGKTTLPKPLTLFQMSIKRTN